MTKHYDWKQELHDLDARDIIKTVRMAREKSENKKPRKWWRPEISGYKTEIAHASYRVRNWFIELKFPFPWQKK